jgi:hypothetical protein
MYCSTSLTRLPVLPRLPCGLVAVLILSLLFHTRPLSTFQPIDMLPSFTIDQGRSLGWRDCLVEHASYAAGFSQSPLTCRHVVALGTQAAGDGDIVSANPSRGQRVERLCESHVGCCACA